MLMPSIFGENLFDDFMDFPYARDWEKDFFGKKNPLYGKNADRLMKTDVKDTDTGYEIAIDLPGFKKDEVKVALENGYLTISAEKGLDKEEKGKEDRFIRKERYSGMCQRSFYVGNSYTSADVKAKYEDGILKLDLPKHDEKKLENNKYIAIDG